MAKVILILPQRSGLFDRVKKLALCKGTSTIIPGLLHIFGRSQGGWWLNSARLIGRTPASFAGSQKPLYLCVCICFQVVSSKIALINFVVI